jgi:hypothetical protein
MTRGWEAILRVLVPQRDDVGPKTPDSSGKRHRRIEGGSNLIEWKIVVAQKPH